ncbi:DnaJ C-terminal domain-containing protein [Silanimonas sp.]|jgi:curved DNA-binding protein|uniref:DnaJ C-terminal domain-containing protein n=1 Tax=Silanimonas sp. TaxID=1929290 RepID=UPI0022C5CDF7|nr:DnaJ C-terminal domain-containing protein [Silanimonas sp.]MCZ8165219.1 DnaJ domain-containing protein [Silanimonas sp.]
MEFKDYYAVLGVEPGSGESEIKQAFRRLARKYHPDVSKEKGAEDRFKAINEAYEVLRDKEKRAQYDALRAGGYRPGQDFRPPPGYGGPGGFGDGFGGGPGGAFSDFFEAFFGAKARQRSAGAGPSSGPRAGAGARPPREDQRLGFAIPLETAYAGGTVRIDVDGREFEVKVPAGIRVGQVIRLAGKGPGGGDLLLDVDFAPHAQFEVDGRNVLYVLPLAPWDAVLGTTATVPTLGGAVELRIPKDSDAGLKLRLKGRGLPGASPGDQIVEIEITAPKPENEAQRSLYRQMALAFGDNVGP